MPLIEDGRGIFFDDGPPKIKLSRQGKRANFDNTVTPKAGYTPPSEFVSILNLDRIALDTETLDPNLKTLGPGVYRRDKVGLRESRIVGVGIGYSIDRAIYYPVAHAARDRCIPNPDAFWVRLRDEAAVYGGEIIGANLQYDLDWLAGRHGVRFPRATFRDVQVAEPLLDENKFKYSLDSLAVEYGLEGKAAGGLRDLYGPGYIENMDLVDPGHAGLYCERDCTLAWEVYDRQCPDIEAQGLRPLFDMESRLTPLLLQMRQNGVRVDMARAQQNYDETQRILAAALARMRELVGFGVEIWAADSLAEAYTKLGIATPKTPGGKSSVTKSWLEAQRDEFSQLVQDARAFSKTGGTFLKSYILEKAIPYGEDEHRLHCQFHPLKTDQNGTVSGRYSSSGPNLQNIPTRHEILGPMCRSVFIPEVDHDWGCADWSQIEYRLLVHFASLVPGIDVRQVLRQYNEDPNTDFHEIAATITGKPRKIAKNINFGVVYGIGVPHMAHTLGVPLAEAERILNEFHAAAPFLKDINNTATARAKDRGFITTLMGRRRRFADWEVKAWGAADSPRFPTKQAAIEWRTKNVSTHGNGAVQRAFTHAALNAVLQGSAADIMKAAMLKAYEDGLFAHGLLVPHLTVHDEFDVSIPRTAIGREAWAELQNVMSTVIKLAVPLKVSAGTGGNWEEAK